MELPKVGILMSAFLKAQLSYFTVVWMSHTNSLNDKINPLLKSCLIIIYNDNFEEMLMKDNSSSIRHNNIHTLAVQMYIAANSTSPKIMSDIFKLRDNTHYYLSHTIQFLVDPIHSIFKGSELASYLGTRIWEQIPAEILTLLMVLKKKLESESL